MKTNDANALYQQFLTKMGAAYDPSKIKGKTKIIIFAYNTHSHAQLDGEFGAMMVVDIANDGMSSIFELHECQC